MSLLRGSPFPLPFHSPTWVQGKDNCKGRVHFFGYPHWPQQSSLVVACEEWVLIPAARLLCLLLPLDQVMGCSCEVYVLDNLPLLTPRPFQCMDFLSLLLGPFTVAQGKIDFCGNCKCDLRCSYCLRSTSLHVPSHSVGYTVSGSQGFLPLKLLEWGGVEVPSPSAHPEFLLPVFLASPAHPPTCFFYGTGKLHFTHNLILLLVPLGYPLAFYLFPAWRLNLSQNISSFFTLRSSEFTSIWSLELAITCFHFLSKKSQLLQGESHSFHTGCF